MDGVYIEHESLPLHTQLVQSLPLVIVLVAGLLLSVARKSRPRSVRIMAAIAVTLFGGILVAANSIADWQVRFLQDTRVDGDVVPPAVWMAVVLSSITLIMAVSLGLLVAAALTPDSQRSERPG